MHKYLLALAMLVVAVLPAAAHAPDTPLKAVPQPFVGSWKAFIDSHRAYPEIDTPFVIVPNKANNCTLTSISQVALSGMDETAKMLRVTVSCPGYKIKEWWSLHVLNGVETLIVATPSVDTINVFIRK